MQYNQEIAEKMLADSRYVGAINEKMLKVWKTRNTIPNQYFNPKYTDMMKKGQVEKANQVHDPYFNPKFILKVELTPDEKKTQNRLIEIFQSEKINVTEICKQVGINRLIFNDACRKDEKQVDLRSEHILALKKNLQELRIKISKVIKPIADRNGRFFEKDVKDIDELFKDKRIWVLPIIQGNRTFQSRIAGRNSKQMTLWERGEIQHYIDCFMLFLAETAS